MIPKCGCILAPLLVLCFCAGAQTAASPAPIGPEATAFLKWYEGYQGSFYPQEVIKAYQARLTGDGVPETEAKRRIGAVQTAMRSMPVEFTTLHFNKIYSSPNPPFRQEASQFLARIADGLKAGAAL